MSGRLPPLNALRAFEVAARHNSFARAAMELHVSHAAISRHVRALEARLGVTLFRRARRGVELTPAGASYLASVSEAFATIADATERIANPSRAHIRVSAQPAFASRWLVHRLNRFREAHPGCDVVLDATARLADLHVGEADLAIRRGEGHWVGLAHDMLARSAVCPVGSPRLLGRRCARLQPSEIAQFVLLHDDEDGGLWHRWFEKAGVPGCPADGGLRILESGIAIDAAVAGQGIVLADEFLIAEDLAEGRLVKLSDVAVSDWDYYLVAPQGRHRQHGPVAAFRDWILSESEDLRA